MTYPQNPPQTPEEIAEEVIKPFIKHEQNPQNGEIYTYLSGDYEDLWQRIEDAICKDRASRPAQTKNPDCCKLGSYDTLHACPKQTEAKRSAEEPEATALERAKDAVIEAARKFCAVRVCTHFSEEEIEKQKQGCLHPLLEALAALDKLSEKFNPPPGKEKEKQ